MEQNDIQNQIIKNMTPSEKLKIAEQMYWSARNLKKAWLKQNNPDWNEEQLEKTVREIFLYARS